MYDFNKILTKNEKILYKGKPVPGKSYNGIYEMLFIIVFTLIILTTIIVIGVKRGDLSDSFDMNFRIVILIIIGALVFGVSGLIYSVVFKKYNVSDDNFCITNKRVIKFEDRENKLSYGKISKYKFIHIINEKDGFGDIVFQMYDNDIANRKDIGILPSNSVNQDLKDMDVMVFECVKNPMRVASIAIKARDNLK